MKSPEFVRPKGNVPALQVSASQARSSPAPLKFQSPDRFRQSLEAKVAEYFRSTGRSPRDCWPMYVKSAIIMMICCGLYITLLIFTAIWWLAIPLAVLLGLALAAAAFNIQHDGSHGAYSNHRRINRLAALTMDLLGGSSYIWARKHNTIHHTYTNVFGHDDDIDIGLLGRLSPQQPRIFIHRLQHLYLWFLYGFLPVKWHLYDDIRDVIVGRVGGHRISRPRGRELAIFIGGKVAFFLLAFGLPMLLHPWWCIVALYGIVSFVQGVTMSVVFQMAHCVELAEFPTPRNETGRIESSWGAHQVQTTVDFATRNPFLTWFVGGLNFQIEHHLFPQVCHVHYPALSKLVQDCCRDFGLKYKEHRTFFAGLISHYRWLRTMGQAAAVQVS